MNNTLVLKCLIPFLLLNLYGFGQAPIFLSNFEDQNTDAEIGKRTLEKEHSNFYISANPRPDEFNRSDYVLKAIMGPGTKSRAEYSTSRHETIEKKYIYVWSRYHPNSLFEDCDIKAVHTNQWKTWPCEAGPVSNTEYEKFDTLICSGGGIFNDMGVYADYSLKYRSRAEPNCNISSGIHPTGYWNKFIFEIY